MGVFPPKINCQCWDPCLCPIIHRHITATEHKWFWYTTERKRENKRPRQAVSCHLHIEVTVHSSTITYSRHFLNVAAPSHHIPKNNHACLENRKSNFTVKSESCGCKRAECGCKCGWWGGFVRITCYCWGIRERLVSPEADSWPLSTLKLIQPLGKTSTVHTEVNRWCSHETHRVWTKSKRFMRKISFMSKWNFSDATKQAVEDYR